MMSSDQLDQRAFPERLGHYRLKRKIGEGGMGVVFLAADEKLHRDVALKILPPDLALRTDLIERFRKEAETLSRLNHPAIVTVYEFGEAGGMHFFAMPFIEGISLREWVQLLERRRQAVAAKETSGPPTDSKSKRDNSSTSGRVTTPSRDLGRMIEVVGTAAEALHHAHKQGVIHRDVKPSNILVDREGHPHLLDFGLAKIIGEATRTQAGSFMGTLPYMSPEQVSDASLPVTARSDIYALGVSLYECLCGRRPFVAETADALALQILMKQAPSPREFAPELARDLTTIVMKCLEKDPARRYSTAKELAQDLDRFRQHRDIEARSVGRVGYLLRWCEAHRLLAVSSVVISLILIVALTLLVTKTIETRNERGRFAIYKKHVDHARELEERRDSARSALAQMRERLQELSDSVAPHLPPTHASKQELYRARAEIRRLESAIANLQGQIEHELQRSREAVEPILVEGSERIAILRRLHSEARARGDEVTMARAALFLADAGIDASLAAKGQLTVVTQPAGGFVTAYPVKEGMDGVRRPDVSSGLDLGETPLRSVELDTGLWQVTVLKVGHQTLRFPVLIEEDENWGDPGWHGGLFADKDWTIPLTELGRFDTESWSFVARGPFQASPDGAMTLNPSLEWRWLDDFCIARKECRFADYEDFLKRPEILKEVMTTVQEQNRFVWVPRLYDWLGVFSLKSDGSLGDGEATQDQPARPYMPDASLAGLSFTELEAFVAWRNESTGGALRIPSSLEWQKAARGVDGRVFPWGDVFDWAFTSGRYSLGPAGPDFWEFHPRVGGSFQIDESPYGAFDMAGNAAEWCQDSPTEDGFGDQRWVMGGSFGWAQPTLFTTWPVRSYPFGHSDIQFGLRLARDP